MNMHVPKSAVAKSHARHVAFHASIAEKAARLKDRAGAHQPRHAAPEAVSAQPDPPRRPKYWFWIVSDQALPRANPSIIDIQRAVARFYGITVNDILSARRSHYIVIPRQIAVYLCKELTPFSLPALGRRFGGRDHTTILHAVRKIQSATRRDPDLAFAIASLFEAITGVAQ